jgi:hypothetical protein
MLMFAVADRLGMTIGEVGERMSTTEVFEWVAYIALQNGQTFGPPIRSAKDLRI